MEQLISPRICNILRLNGRFSACLRCIVTQSENSASNFKPATSTDGKTAPGRSTTTANRSSDAANDNTLGSPVSPNVTPTGVLLPKDRQEKVDLSHDDGKSKAGDDRKTAAAEKSAPKQKRNLTGTMKAWQINQFCDAGGLQLNKECRVPSLSDPFDVLVEVKAASVNPFDIERQRGYGENLIQYMRSASNFSWSPASPFARKETPFPLTLGRDFSGIIADAGKRVTTLKTGDEVFGVIGPHRQGSFAEYVATNLYCIAKKPKGMTHSAAASLPYIACTAWQVLKLVENLPAFSTKRVLLIGASGGVGSFSLQYLKTLPNVHVTAVVGSAAVDLAASLGADEVIDYQTSNVEEELKAKDKFDVVFQAAQGDYEFTKSLLKGKLKSFFVTLNYPLLYNLDEFGPVSGMARTVADYSMQYAKGLAKGYHIVWAFFAPNYVFLEQVAQMVDRGQIRATIDTVYPFDQLPVAFQQVESGNTKGKVIVQIAE